MYDFGKSLLEEIFSFSSFNLFNDFLKGIMESANSLFEGSSILQILQIIGYSFLLVWFCVDLMDSVSMQQFTLDQFFKKFLFLAAGVILISNVDVFTGQVPGLAVSLSDELIESNKDSKSVDIVIKLWEAIDKSTDFSWTDIPSFIGGIIIQILDLLLILIIWLVTKILGFIIFAFKASACIETGVRGLFSPIGCADISRGLNGNCMRYLRRYIACAFQLVVITGIAIVCSAVASNTMEGLIRSSINLAEDFNIGDLTTGELSTTLLTSCFAALIMYVAAIMLVGKAKNISDDIFGTM